MDWSLYTSSKLDILCAVAFSMKSMETKIQEHGTFYLPLPLQQRVRSLLNSSCSEPCYSCWWICLFRWQSSDAHFGRGSRGKSGKVSFNIVFTCIGINISWSILTLARTGRGERVDAPQTIFLATSYMQQAIFFLERGLIFCIAYFLTFLHKVC